MAKISQIVRNQKKLKYSNRKRNRCLICGRPRAFLRQFGVCRLCFRELANKGELPGVTKASW